MRNLDRFVAGMAIGFELLGLVAIFFIVFAVVIGLPLVVAAFIGWALS